MRPALLSLAMIVGMIPFAGPCIHGDSQAAAVPDRAADLPMVEPAVLTTEVEAVPAPVCPCPNGGDCICVNGQCTCPPVVKPAIKPASYTPAKAPPGYICGPNGCYPASSGAPASGNCASGNCGTASYGDPSYRRAPVRRVFGGIFRRRR